MIKMIGFIKGVKYKENIIEYIIFYIQNNKLIITSGINSVLYTQKICKVDKTELLNNLKLSKNIILIDKSNYDTFHYMISTQIFHNQTDLYQNEFYGQSVSEDVFQNYLLYKIQGLKLPFEI